MPTPPAPSGYRWDDVAVGDDVAGMCTPFDEPPCTEEIAWLSERDGNREIYAADPDGTNPHNLTRSPEDEDSPVWSPNGDQVAFLRNGEIWVMAGDGSNAHAVTDGGGSQPQWAPDGSMIVFVRVRTTGLDTAIWTVDVTSGEQTEVTLDASARDSYPSWSPDGALLAFETARDIYTMRPDGTERTNRSNDGMTNSGNYGRAVWSPDSTHIIYVSTKTGDSEVWSVPVAGGAPTNLTQSPSTDDFAMYGVLQWSADGGRIYFTRRELADPANTFELFRMGPTGTAQTPLGLLEYSPVVAEFDGEMTLAGSGQIAWTSERDDPTNDADVNSEIYVADPDQGTPIRITNVDGRDQNPIWRPCP